MTILSPDEAKNVKDNVLKRNATTSIFQEFVTSIMNKPDEWIYCVHDIDYEKTIQGPSDKRASVGNQIRKMLSDRGARSVQVSVLPLENDERGNVFISARYNRNTTAKVARV